MKTEVVPDAGDIVWLEFTPQAGREQAGHRPAVVLSPMRYNAKVGLMVCVPLTTRIKGYPFEVAIAGERESVALVDQVKSLDWRVRKAVAKGRVSPAELTAIRQMLWALIGDSKGSPSPRRREQARMPSEWYILEQEAGAVPSLPGIYEWRVDGVVRYVGKAEQPLDRVRQYARNLHNLLSDRPYRARNPDGFREIHDILAEAVRNGSAISFVVLENCPSADLNRRERELSNARLGRKF